MCRKFRKKQLQRKRISLPIAFLFVNVVVTIAFPLWNNIVRKAQHAPVLPFYSRTQRQTNAPIYSIQSKDVLTLLKDISPSYKDDRVDLSTGISMQVLVQTPTLQRTTSATKTTEGKPVLLFLHGSMHGAWCWVEHWMEYFVNAGYTVVAPSWRGTGGTLAGPGVKKVQIKDHVQDLNSLLLVLPELLQRHNYTPHNCCDDDDTNTNNNNNDLISPGSIQPVVICHSFAGMTVMKYLEEKMSEYPFRGIVTLCSVPPSGNGKMTMRFLRRSWTASWRITVGFAMKRCLYNPTLCKQLFFGGDKILSKDGTIVEDHGISDRDLQRYQSYFIRDSVATIDLIDLARQLPSSTIDRNGRAKFMQTSITSSGPPPCLVMGAKDDYIVDSEGLEETARYFGLEQPLLVDSPHDVMLGKRWQEGAKALKEWLDANF